MSYEQLPKEIWKEISMAHYGTYNILVRCSKKFQLEDDFIKSHFVRKRVQPSNIKCISCIESVLPNGWLHSRYDEPAKVFANGVKYWYKNNKRHRSNNQPAAIGHISQEWWIHGVCQHRQSIMIQKNNINSQALTNICVCQSP
jgi:hypothetical protein